MPKPRANAADPHGHQATHIRAGSKGRLGKSLDSHVDPTASGWPVSLLSRPRAEPLRPGPDCGILSPTMTTAAVFWDRDNTLIEDPGYLHDPKHVKLLPGAAAAVRRLSQAGLENIIVTNQSGLARGLFDEATLEKIHDRLRELLAAEDARLDAIYYCPYLDGPEAVVEQYRQDSDLRKPRPGMLAKASLERKIDLAASWVVGNSLADTQAGRAAGSRTILLSPDKAAKDRSVDFVARSLDDAVEIVLKHTVGLEQAAPAGDSPAAADRQDAGAVSSTLQEILSFLRMVDRRQQADDFSLNRLVGVLVQMLAVAALVWAIFSMIRGEDYGAQIVRLLFALMLQLIALTCFSLASRR
ncbi:MAG: HAD family hydrolase [Planctomycetes bacterium]|nr:HAD family hydrolase [Planctomycetota bacterium]